MLLELVRAFVLIFVAEMGDKSQILAMSFATKYKVKYVVIGLSIGIFFNHLLAVLLGSNITVIFPLENISIIAGVLFILFGYYTLYDISNEEEEVKSYKFGPIVTVSIAFFLGELGDKTQLTAIVLASDAVYPYIVLVGTVLGMIFTSLIGIYLGIKLGAKIPEFLIKVISSFVFILFGFFKVLSNVNEAYLSPLYIFLTLAITLVVYGYLFLRFRKANNYRTSSYKRAASELKYYFGSMKTKLDTICLGDHHCGTCSMEKCLLGYTKSIVRRAMDGEVVDLSYIEDKTIKEFDKNKVEEALVITLEELKKNWNNQTYLVLHQIRNNFELILYGKAIKAGTYKAYMQIKKGL